MVARDVAHAHVEAPTRSNFEPGRADAARWAQGDFGGFGRGVGHAAESANFTPAVARASRRFERKIRRYLPGFWGARVKRLTCQRADSSVR